MADDDLTSLIRERQRRAECEAAGVKYVPDELAVRAAPHCDPDTTPRKDELSGPNAAPVPDPGDRLLPAALLIRSPEVVVVCADHGGGAGDATSAYGESVIELFLDDVAQLTRAELYRIAPNQVALQAALDANLEDLVAGNITDAQFDAAIIAASTMESAAAVGVRVKAVELRGGPDVGSGSTGLYAIAEITALSRLVCQFYSDELWVACDSEAPTGFATSYVVPDPLPGAAFYRYRSASFASSTVSVADANELAILDAVSDPTFECVYLSEEQVVTCADVDAAFDHTYVPAFTWDGTPYDTLADLGAAGFSSYALDSLVSERELVFSVTLAAGAYPSATQAIANERANAAALRQLNCFFPSREAVVDCANRSVDNPVTQRMTEMGWTAEQVFAEMDDDYTTAPELATNYGVIPNDPGPGAELDTKTALVVTLPAGMVSATDPDEAEDEARLHALGFLSCLWVVPATSCDCLDLWSQEELDELNVTINTGNSTGVLVFEKGALGASETGPVGGGDVDALCQASLTCVYCNKTKAPRCHIAYDGEDVSYDLWAPQDDTSLPLDLETSEGVSAGISSGLPAGVICDSDPRLVDTLAEATSLLPPPVDGETGDPVCRYGNRPQSLSCVEKVDTDPGDPKSFALTPESAARSMTVAAGTFDAETQAEADALANAFLEAALVCEFGNPAMVVLCGAVVDQTPPTAADFSVGADPPTYGDGQGVTAEDAKGGVDTPLSIAAYAFTSLESPTSAKAQAMLALVSQLDCFWLNPQIDVLCNSPASLPEEFLTSSHADFLVVGDNEPAYAADSIGDVENEAVVEAASITSYVSQADANTQAYRIARQYLDCFWQSARIELLCGSPKFYTDDTPETGTITGGDESGGYHSSSTGDEYGEVFLESKGVVSYISQEDANGQAWQIAWAQLDCFWVSAQVDLLCGAPPVLADNDPRLITPPGVGTIEAGGEDGTKVYHPDSTGDAPGEVSLAVGAVVSYQGQKDANRQAYQLAAAQLDCFFGSAAIELRCGAARSNASDTPYSGVITSGTNEENWSDESNGDEVGEVSLASAAVISYISQSEANKQAYQTAYDELDCFFQSAAIELQCGAERMVPAAQAGEGPDSSISSGTNQDRCCADSTGSDPGEVALAARAITSYESQEDANAQAYSLALAQLDCYWQSARVNLRCTAPADMPLLYVDYREFQEIKEGDVKVGPPREPLGESTYSPSSHGYDWDDVVSEAKEVVSYVSQEDANRRAYRSVWSQLDCFWKNAEVTMSCVPARFPTTTQLLSGEGISISGGGSENEVMTTAAGAITSYHNQADANMQAYQITRAQLNCDGGNNHAFGVGGIGTFACCKVKFNQQIAELGQNKLYAPTEAGAGLNNTVPGYVDVDMDTEGVEVCGEFPAYFYLEAPLHKREGDVYAQYYSTQGNVVIYKDEQPALDGEPGSYNAVRRLLAIANQEDSDSSTERDSKDDCGDLNIAQLVTKAQKIVSSSHDGVTIPTITDVDTPHGGGSSPESHDWKVTRGSLPGTVSVAAGRVVTNAAYEVNEVAVTELAVSEPGHVVLNVIRDNATRAFVSAAIAFDTSDPLADSDYYSQTIPLAYVTTLTTEDGVIVDKIRQIESLELRMTELMIVVNGALRLIEMRTGSRKPYEPPPSS